MIPNWVTAGMLSGGEAQRTPLQQGILKRRAHRRVRRSDGFTDAENELALREGMAELLCSKTVLMIAHRLYSIQMRTASCIENGS